MSKIKLEGKKELKEWDIVWALNGDTPEQVALRQQLRDGFVVVKRGPFSVKGAKMIEEFVREKGFNVQREGNVLVFEE
jgi:hypothetical protein